MSDQPWVVAEKYRGMQVGDEWIENPMIIVGPFDSEEEAIAYKDWVTEVTGGGNLFEVAVGQIARVPEAFGVKYGDDATGTDRTR